MNRVFRPAQFEYPTERCYSHIRRIEYHDVRSLRIQCTREAHTIVSRRPEYFCQILGRCIFDARIFRVDRLP